MSNMTPEERFGLNLYRRIHTAVTIANAALWLCRLPKVRVMELTNGIRYTHTRVAE